MISSDQAVDGRLVIITRPEPAASILAAWLVADGFQPMVAPMLTIRPRAQAMPDLGGAAAVLLTSANALVGLAAQPADEQARLRALPALCVGAATAAAAEAVGFSVHSCSGKGDGGALAEAVAARFNLGDGWLLHIAGEDVAGGLDDGLTAAGFDHRRWTVYGADPATVLLPAVAAALAGGKPAAVVFFSGRAAAAFARLMVDRPVAAGCHFAFCLSDRVASVLVKAALPWAGVHVLSGSGGGTLMVGLAEWRDTTP